MLEICSAVRRNFPGRTVGAYCGVQLTYIDRDMIGLIGHLGPLHKILLYNRGEGWNRWMVCSELLVASMSNG